MLPKNSTKKVIVLSGDYSYINQITTTIKSVLYHDRGIKFYLINSDIPQEWFRLINQHLAPLASVIIDKKSGNQQLRKNTLAWGTSTQLPMARL